MTNINISIAESTGTAAGSGSVSSREPAIPSVSGILDGISRRNIRAIARLETAAASARTPVDRVVDTITVFCGSMAFVYVHAIWFGLWIGLNVITGFAIAKSTHFDPFPFPLLTLVVSLEAIFLSTFILISQNRQGQVAERRNHLDLQINLLSEQESTKMLSLLARIANRVGVACSDDSEMAELSQATSPESLVAEIESVIEGRPAQDDSRGN